MIEENLKLKIKILELENQLTENAILAIKLLNNLENSIFVKSSAIAMANMIKENSK